MLKEADLLEILEDIIPHLKSANDKKEPCFNEVYEMSVKQKRRIEIHAEDGVYPEELFAKRAPNQTQEEYDYLKANYKTITLPVWQSFQSLLNRIWVDQNWKIEYPNEEVQKFLEEEYPIYGSLESFFKDVVTNQKELDNNGVLVAKPYYIPTIEQDGEVIVNDREYIDPIIYYYSSEHVIDYKLGEYCVILSNEKSHVEYQGRPQKIGYVIEVYDKDSIFKFVQKGKKTDYEFDIIIAYKHDLGYLPAWKLNGKSKQVGDRVFYQSVFISAVANLDRATLDDSYLTAKKAQVAYPHKWEYVSECEYQEPTGEKCIAGNVTMDGRTYKCPSCKGSGKKTSVMGVTQIEMPTMFDQSSNSIAPPFLGFVEPGTDNLKFLRDEIEKYIAKAASMLKLDITETSVKGSETATGDAISREETFTLIKGISDQIFALFYNCNKALIQMRFGKEKELPKITPPRVFELRSDFDITEEIVKLKQAGMPDVIIVQAIKEFMNIRFSLDIEAQKILNLSTYADRLITLSPDDIIKKKASGTVAGWEDILHTSMYAMISQAIITDPNLFDKTIEEQRNVLVTMAKQMDSSINSSPASTSSILGNANA